ncbi:MAG: DUF2147 domain-containing protein [Cyclobacteriaceae bacterium]|jgi:uncharacterized protein (DUF2147 family)|nr:DUF2147 domain-containing protein [Flammeovirgaceae bacterium]
MKNSLFILLLALSSSIVFAQTESDAILGVWETGSGKARVKIDKVGDKFYGKVVWLREPLNEEGKPKVDKNNPEENLRTVPILGYKLIKDFSYKGDKTWEDGTIYDPENGSTYSCTIKMTDENTLDVRGFIGVSIFGRTDVWKRVQLKKK